MAKPKVKTYGEDNKDLPKNLSKILKDLVDKVEKEDSWIRKQQIKLWKKNDEFWHGIQFIFWSESRQDWISPVETRWFQQEEGREEAEGPFYDFVVNIYKAHGESIIAALSSQIPTVRFPPDDAVDPDDIATSRAYGKIADLIQRHNKSKILLLRCLFTLWNQGIVCAYHAPKADKAFGNVQIPQYEEEDFCPACTGSTPATPEQGGDSTDQSNLEEQQPNESDHELGKNCETCGSSLSKRTVLAGFSESPKTRVLIDLYGPLFVKVPFYARKPEEFGYCILQIDQPKAKLKSLYEWVADEIDQDYTEAAQFERLARTPSSYSSFSRVDENRELACLRRCWLETWQLEALPKELEEEKKELKKLFPTGIYCAFIGSTYVESRDECMHDYWKFGQSGLSQYFHSDPLGQPLIPMQELKNVLINLTVETIEQGIPSTYASTKAVDFETYSRHENRPGMLYPVTPEPGKRISDSFYEGGRASLSKEVPYFNQELDKMGQFVTGSLPSIFGGIQDAKSRTAAEYNMSRQMALQRLSLTWNFLCDFWARLIAGCVKQFVETMVDDEKFVVENKSKASGYENIWVLKSELSGHVGEVEPEGADSFPISTPQKQALFMKILEMKDEFLAAAAYSTDNRSLVADLLGFPDFKIPGEDQRIKQLREIEKMLEGQPVQIEPLVDDDTIHATVCRSFLTDEGYALRDENPVGYQLVSAHLQMHIQDQAQKQLQQFGNTPPGISPDQPQPAAE
jgi:hypothetical protein